jgi:hypothetical protein
VHHVIARGADDRALTRSPNANAIRELSRAVPPRIGLTRLAIDQLGELHQVHVAATDDAHVWTIASRPRRASFVFTLERRQHQFGAKRSHSIDLGLRRRVDHDDPARHARSSPSRDRAASAVRHRNARSGLQQRIPRQIQ